MSEPRWNDAGTRPLPRDVQGTYPSQRTRNARVPAEHWPPPAERHPRWGALPFARGIVLVISSVAIGTVITILAGRDPGFVLGFCLLIGTIAASFAVRPGGIYRVIPAPALAYLVGAVIAGLIHDRAADTTRTALAISAAQWAASGFLAMTAATVLVILIGAVRWGRHRRRSFAVGPRDPLRARNTAGPRYPMSPRSAGGTGNGRRRSGPPGPGY